MKYNDLSVATHKDNKNKDKELQELNIGILHDVGLLKYTVHMEANEKAKVAVSVFLNDASLLMNILGNDQDFFMEQMYDINGPKAAGTTDFVSSLVRVFPILFSKLPTVLRSEKISLDGKNKFCLGMYMIAIAVNIFTQTEAFGWFKGIIFEAAAIAENQRVGKIVRVKKEESSGTQVTAPVSSRNYILSPENYMVRLMIGALVAGADLDEENPFLPTLKFIGSYRDVLKELEVYCKSTYRLEGNSDLSIINNWIKNFLEDQKK
jgi:hypothetical protein